MTKHLLRLAAVGAAVMALHGPARAQDSIPAPLPWGISGQQVATSWEAAQMRVMLTRAGREVHASSQNRHLQAVAILRSDSLVGLVYFHPENAQSNAFDLFTLATRHAEQRHGPPFCRRSDLAVWTLDGTRVEVRLRRSAGDGAPGAEIRYIGPGYVEEMARRTASRRSTPRPAPAQPSGGPRLLGSPVPPPPPAPEPVPAPVAEVPAPDACVAIA